MDPQYLPLLGITPVAGRSFKAADVARPVAIVSHEFWRTRGMPARRVLARTFTAFALLALVLSAVGLFGVVAHDVGARRSELALRLALGAPPARLFAATLRQGTTMIGAGVAVGLGLSVWSGKC